MSLQFVWFSARAAGGEVLPNFCFRPALVHGSWRLEDGPKLAGGLETGCGVQVRPGFDHRFHSGVCEQDSTHTGDGLPKEALDSEAGAQVQRRQAAESSAGVRYPHGIAQT